MSSPRTATSGNTDGMPSRPAGTFGVLIAGGLAAVVAALTLCVGCRQPVELPTSVSYHEPVTLAVSVAPVDAGSVVVATEASRQLRAGDEVTVTAVPAPGRLFERWSGEVDSRDNPLSIRIERDASLVATFEKAAYPVTLAVEGEGSVSSSESISDGKIVHGAEIAVSPVPAEGWAFSAWRVSSPGGKEITSTETSLSLPVRGPLSIKAVFTRLEYPVTALIAGRGRIDISTSGGAHFHGDAVVLEAVPEDGHRFSRWEGGATGSANPLSIEMHGALRLTAVFDPIEYRVLTFTEGRGAVHATHLDGEVLHHGGRVRLQAVPEDGWHFVRWRAEALADALAEGSAGAAGGAIGGPGGKEAGLVDPTANPVDLTAAGDIVITGVFAADPLSVTVSAVGGGRALAQIIDGSRDYYPGTAVRLLAEADSGSVFSRWEGGVGGSANPLELVLDASLAATAVFAPSRYRISTESLGAGRVSVTLLDGQSLEHGGRVRLAATAEAGWRFSGWQGDAEGTENPLVVSATKDLEVRGVFEEIPRTIDVRATDGGSAGVSSRGGEAGFFDGRRVRLTATAHSGYEFLRWEGDVAGTANPKDFTVDGDAAVTAVFGPMRYRLMTFTDGSGRVRSTFLDADELYHGGKVRLEAEAEEGFQFARWSGSLETSDNPVTITADGDVRLTAHFERVPREVTITTVGGGTAEARITDGSETYRDGTRITLVATPRTGRLFARWEGGVTGTANPLGMTVDGDLSVTAVFSPTQYRVLTSVEGDGEVSAALLDGQSLEYGGRVRFTANAEPGWEFSRWHGTAVGSENPIVVTAAGDLEVTAVFEPVAIDVSVSSVGGGSVHAEITDGSLGYFLGTRVRFAASADRGWSFVEWQGDLTGAVNPLSLTLEGGLSAHAVFERIEFDVEATVVGEGTVTNTYDGEVDGLVRLRLDATPARGWRFDQWAGDASGSLPQAFVVLDSDKDVEAKFARIVYAVDCTTKGRGSVTHRVLGGGAPVLGAQVELRAEAAEGWTFHHWGHDVTATDNPITLPVSGDVELEATFVENVWTLLLYMSGDNELEQNMLEDINELEGVDVSGTGINIVVLADRAVGHATADGDWTGTRLYRIGYDANGVDSTIVSRRLCSSELGLSDAGDDDELNLGDPASLRSFLDFGMSAFPAPFTALVLWGHGGGYRSAGARRSGAGPREIVHGAGSKAVSIDDGSDGDMLLTPELGLVLRDRGLSVLGLDLCFGASLELAYEIREDVGALVASQNLVGRDGWEYDDLLTRLSGAAPGERGFMTAAVEHFAAAYDGSHGATISAIDLSRVGAVSDGLDDLAGSLGAWADTADRRNAMRTGILSDVVSYYETPGDLFVDLKDLARYVKHVAPTASASATRLAAAVDEAVVQSWLRGGEEAGGLSVHYVPLDADGYPVRHAPAYFRDSEPASALAFVSDSEWVPDESTRTGLLFRLWYEDF